MKTNKIQSHRDLIVWWKAMDMSVRVYKLAESFPKTETYRLTSQITRSAVSVPANIADYIEVLKRIMSIFWRSQKVH